MEQGAEEGRGVKGRGAEERDTRIIPALDYLVTSPRRCQAWTRVIIRTIKMIMLAGLLGPAALALASSGRPLPPSGIYAISPIPDDPAPVPSVHLMPDTRLYNQLVYEQMNGIRDLTDDARVQGESISGPGVLAQANGMASGGTLFPSATACLTFNDQSKWNGHIWYAAYGNWGTFSVDDGGFYRSEHVRFDMERTTGPGDQSGSAFAFKIAGSQPYAAGLVSPVIQAPAGSVVSVRVKYLMYNHDGVRVGSQIVNDWVSLGLKPNAHGDEATYVNGYTRGQWSELSNSVVTGDSGQILVLIQAESPAALNSNIYFDDVEIAIDGMPLTNCE